MKKFVTFAAANVITLLAFHFSAAAAQAPAAQSVAPSADASAALKKAMADLDASSAELNKFVSDQGKDGAAASNSAQSAELQKAMANLKAITDQIDRLLKDQAPDGAAPEGLQSAEVQKATAALDASAAEVNKFVSDQGQATPEAALQLSSRFGSRPPRPCPNITSTPTAAQAATLVQCTMDYEAAQQAKLHQDIVVKLGSARRPTSSDRWPSIDSRALVVDFSANATAYVCGPVLEAVMHNTGSNCDRYRFQSAPGVCWRTLQGSYRCQINAGLPTDPARSVGPPTTY